MRLTEGDPVVSNGRNVRLTGTWMAAPPVGVMVIVPVEFVVRDPTVTVTVGPAPLVVKVPGETASQELPAVTAAL